MSGRELVVLGTASQVPTRHRNHNAYLLRWDGEGILFDPGEGTQRQLTHAGVPASAITRICITHFHGDHCLGLPGVLQRLSLDGAAAVDVYFPADGAPYFERLRHASVADEVVDVRPHPVTGRIAATGPPFSIVAAPLDHRTATLGWRIEEPDGRRMLSDRLDALRIRGPDVGRLQREGVIWVGGRSIGIDEVSERRRGQKVAFVMDTRMCDNAVELAADADLVVCESTYLEADAELAERHGHLTARQAATIARDAGARLLVLTHFSQRYADAEAFGDEAAQVFPDVVVAEDLLRVAVPRRAG